MDQSRDLPEALYPPPVVIRVLMVTDGNGSYAIADGELRSLQAVVETIGTMRGWAAVEVQTAHREPFADGTMDAYAATAHLQRFRFTDEALAGFDELWVFGVDLEPSRAITGAEAAVIDGFVSRDRKGLLAMGDHYPRGTPLCGGIPRVRGMRLWQRTATDDAPTPPGEAPSYGTYRIDSRIATSGSVDDHLDNTFEDDATPQPIRPRIYGSGAGSGLFRLAGYPHPLLCGPRGAITIMPDHMHEGWCEIASPVPAEFEGVDPEIIAWGESHAAATNGQRFGVISVWDGNDVDRGRIVTQSTWHHFVWLNVQGFHNATDPVAAAHWDDLQAYYRNLVLWLAPATLRRRILDNAIWWSRWQPQVDEVLVKSAYDDVGRLRYVGEFGMNVLGQATSRCWTMQTLFELIGHLAPAFHQQWMLSPWAARPKQKPVPFIAPESVCQVVVGGILSRLRDEFPVYAVPMAKMSALEKELPRLVEEGAARALRALAASVATSAGELTDWAKNLSRSVGR